MTATAPLAAPELLQEAAEKRILREDIPAVLASAAGRQPTGRDLAAVLRCFVLDVSAAISWSEFERSWRLLQRGGSVQAATGRAGTRGFMGRRANMVASEGSAALATKASHSTCSCEAEPFVAGTAEASDTHALQLQTTQQEIGWHHTAAPMHPPACRSTRGTDVTRGGQGSSLKTYFGMHLS